MDSLPQVHDWFAGLLTPNQWLFAWIIASLVLVVVVIWAVSGEPDLDDLGAPGDVFGASLFLIVLIPILVWALIYVLLNIVSFMIFLLNT